VARLFPDPTGDPQVKKPPAQPVTFQIPEVFITISVKDALRISNELRRMELGRPPGDRLALADLLDKTVRGQNATQRIVVEKLPAASQHALLRAVEHVRLAGEMSKES
jgi:hypothetical protein